MSKHTPAHKSRVVIYPPPPHPLFPATKKADFRMEGTTEEKEKSPTSNSTDKEKESKTEATAEKKVSGNSNKEWIYWTILGIVLFCIFAFLGYNYFQSKRSEKMPMSSMYQQRELLE